MFAFQMKKMRFFLSLSVVAISVLFCGVSLARIGIGGAIGGGPWPTHPSQRGQRIFHSPQDAAQALIAAMSANDRQKLTDILGHQGERVVFPAHSARRIVCERYVRAYREKHRIVEISGNRAVIEMGKEDQPFPVPLAKVRGYWRFSAKHGGVRMQR